MLAERLAAEGLMRPTPPGRDRDACPNPPWTFARGPRRSIVRRTGSCQFDLDGVAKGWIADRALALLDRYPAAMVDADGDIAIRADAQAGWMIGIEDPSGGRDLTHVRVGTMAGGQAIGIATSGTTVHRWGAIHHHLIDPWTGTSARTDVAQATVIAPTAALAECLAKAAVIRGSEAGLDLLERSGALGGLVVLESGELLALPRTRSWLQ
jgi:thiamine biosynthesis lipoprotein